MLPIPLQISICEAWQKKSKLGTLGDFEFVVDYASMVSLDTVFEISQWMPKNKYTNNPIQIQ